MEVSVHDAARRTPPNAMRQRAARRVHIPILRQAIGVEHAHRHDWVRHGENALLRRIRETTARVGTTTDRDPERNGRHRSDPRRTSIVPMTPRVQAGLCAPLFSALSLSPLSSVAIPQSQPKAATRNRSRNTFPRQRRPRASVRNTSLFPRRRRRARA